MGQIKLINSLVLIGLFTIAVIGFAINFAIDNDSAIDIADDSEINVLQTNVLGNTTSFSSDSNTTYTQIIGSQITSGDTTTSGSQFALTPVNAISTVRTILLVGYSKIFGSERGFNIFLTTFLSMITFMIGLYIWKTWKGGSPD